MQITIDDKEIAKAIAEYCYDNAAHTFDKGIYEYSGVYNILQAKIAKLVDDNKDIIITRASEIAAKRIEKNINLRTVLALPTANREKQ